jgi:hypothetical protein
LLVLVLVIVAVAAVPAGAVKSRKPQGQHVSELYVLTAGGGTLRPLPGRRFAVTLTRVDRNVVWFSDRPVHKSGTFPSNGLASRWKGFGFASQPPNAALVYPDPKGDGSTVILELGRPRYNAHRNSISFTARWIDPKTVRSANLAEHAKHADPTPNRRFSHASLFIDSSTSQAIGGCSTPPPGGTCLYDNLANTDLTGADLSDTDFTEADFTAANLTGANLSHDELYGAVFGRASLRNANLTDADLDKVDLMYADLTGANLTGATLDGLLDHATFCHTTMPNGSINNTDCP